MSKVYLAMYKAEGNWVDKVIRLFTGKPYSHCEIFIEATELRVVYDEDFEPILRYLPCYKAYSSSPRDGGVRCKTISIPTNTYGGAFKPENWDLIPLPTVSGQKIEAFYQKTKGKKYDFLGAIACVLPLPERTSRYFCSEWCYEAILGKAPDKPISPNRLSQIIEMLFG